LLSLTLEPSWQFQQEPEEDLTAKIAAEAAERRQELQVLVVKVNDQGEQLTRVTTQLRSMLWEIEAAHKDCVRQIQTQTQSTILELQQREQELLLQVNKAHAEKVAQLTPQAESLETTLMQVRSGGALYAGPIFNANDLELMNMADEVGVALKEMAEYEWSREPVCDGVLSFTPEGGLTIGTVVTEAPKVEAPPPQEEAPGPSGMDAEGTGATTEPVVEEAAPVELDVTEAVDGDAPVASAFKLPGVFGGSSTPPSSEAQEPVEPPLKSDDIEDLLTGSSELAMGGACDDLLMPSSDPPLDAPSGGSAFGLSGVGGGAPAPASTDDLMDLFDVSDLPAVNRCITIDTA